MHRRYAGVGFIMVAAFLYASRFILVALFVKAGVDSSTFDRVYSEIGQGLTNCADISLLVGVVYVVAGEVEEMRKASKKADRQEAS
jgi:hypothetical protein